MQISASTWHEKVAMLSWFKARHHTGGDSGSGTRSATILRVKNTTGAGIERFSVLGLSQPNFTPSDDLNAFQRDGLLFRGRTPVTLPTATGPQNRLGDVGRFCVTLEPLPDGGIGDAVYAGLVQCRIDVDDATADYQYAEITDGEGTVLRAGYSGSAKIVWKPIGESGTVWGVVELTGREHRMFRWAKYQATQETWAKGTSLTLLACDDNHENTGDTVLAWNHFADVEPGETDKNVLLLGNDRKLEVIAVDPCEG